jgi:polyhydroxyalkanoate synthesis regulator phasin
MTNANFPNPAQMTEMVLDQWVNSMNLVARTQEQAENATRTWLDQGRTVREQGQAVVAKVAEQAKDNQRLFQEMVTSTVRLSMETYRIATQQSMSELTKRVDELNQQVERLTRQAQVANN